MFLGKKDIDRIKQRAGGRKKAIKEIKVVIVEYANGATPSSCMLKIIRILKKYC